MKRAIDDICPRCEGPVPNAEHQGEYPGALSRVAAVEICSACGTDEAMQDWQGGGATPMSEWPVKAYMALTQQILEATTWKG